MVVGHLGDIIGDIGHTWMIRPDGSGRLHPYKAAQANEDAGLAALEGSGKQVAWAEEIRSKYMPKYAQERQEWADHGATDEQLASPAGWRPACAVSDCWP